MSIWVFQGWKGVWWVVVDMEVGGGFDGEV